MEGVEAKDRCRRQREQYRRRRDRETAEQRQVRLERRREHDRRRRARMMTERRHDLLRQRREDTKDQVVTRQSRLLVHRMLTTVMKFFLTFILQKYIPKLAPPSVYTSDVNHTV